MKLSTPVRRLGLPVAGLCLALFGRLAAQGGGSLKNLDMETEHPAANAEALLQQNTALRQKLAENENSLRALQQSFGSISNEAEVFRRKSSELNARLEALGPASIDSRLIKLLGELKIATGERSKLRDALIGLTEAAARYQKHAGKENAGINGELESAMKESTEALGLNAKLPTGAPTIPARLTDSIVVSVKDELALIVANVGLHHGARLGMPFDVVRGDTVIGTIRIVDVREKISGALIQNLSKDETIKVGDRLRVTGH